METKLYQMTVSQIEEYTRSLAAEEKSDATIEKYHRDVRSFYLFLERDGTVTKERVISYKKRLMEHYRPASVNSMLAALNHFLLWAGWGECRVRALKIQRQAFAEPERELSRGEYEALCRAAEQKKNMRLSLVMQTICATGIRVSELKFITAEAVRSGRALVDCKGKRRTVLLPRRLCRKLQERLKRNKITAGPVFLSRSGNPLSRSQIWADMKKLCEDAGVNPRKVFPHNLRHLFARTFYAMEKDIIRLADILGHASVNTTRIYTMESGTEHQKLIDQMRLVS